MSASPQPPPPPPGPRDDPAPQLNGSPPAPASSPAQLAALLTKSLQEAEALRAELAHTKRRADKAERLLATFQSSQSPPHPSPPGSSHGSPPKPPQLPEAARKAILDSENRADRAEQARDEAEARLRMLQESWSELERFLAQLEIRGADARAQFSRIVADAGGPLVQVSALPAQNAVYLPSALHQHHIQLPPLPASRAPARSRASGSSQPFPSVALPPPPSASSSRVRPRAGSMDTAYNGVLSGPGAPPPAKRPRNDRDSDRSRERQYSLSPSNSPHPAYLTNGHSVDHSPPLTVHHANALPALHPHSYQSYHRSAHRSDRDDPAAARYPSGAYVDQHPHRHRRGRSTSRDRDRSSRSRSHSRASSLSLEEMLIEATTTPAEERPGPDGVVHPRAIHPSQQQQQHLHPSSRHRSPSPGRDYHHLSVPAQHAHPRSRGNSSVQLHPGTHAVPSPPGPLTVPGQVQTYQTHIFAPPVTGAPVKKSKLGAGGSMGTNGSVLTLDRTGSVIAGPSTLGGGGFPPTNAQGQRICRQCGLPGRYKDGKCVEKWGPGPEGPGTVCDRCRKKMKRVERRGTLDGHNMAVQMHHHAPAAIHPSGAPQAAPGALTNGHALHRSDTLHVHPSQSQSQSQSQSRTLGPSGTHLLSSTGSSPQGSYARHDREYDHPASPRSHYSGGRPAQRTPPTPPYIATLPGSSAADDDGGAYDEAPRSRASRAASRERPSSHMHKSSAVPAAGLNGHAHHSSGSSRSASRSPASKAAGAGSPRGSKSSSELMDVDADGEEVDADADADAEADDADADADADAEAEGEGEGEGEGDADADAELLEAVDAAEANNATDEEWLKKESSDA